MNERKQKSYKMFCIWKSLVQDYGISSAFTTGKQISVGP